MKWLTRFGVDDYSSTGGTPAHFSDLEKTLSHIDSVQEGQMILY